MAVTIEAYSACCFWEKCRVDTNLVLVLSFIIYSGIIIGVGLYSTRWRKSTTDDYVLANRELGPWASALSASASSESGWVMLGLVGEAYLFGGAAFWIVPGIAAGYLFNWFVIAERLRKVTLDSGAVTLPQYILHRFDSKSMALRIIPVAIIVLALLTYVAAQMNAAGKAFEAVFHLPYVWGVLAGAAIILAYTITGGFRAICWTDIIQASFMVIALVGMPLLLLTKMGGYGSFTAASESVDPHLLTYAYDKTGFAVFGFVIGLLGIGLGYPGQPHVLSRFMAARDTTTVRRGRVIAMVWMILAYLGAVFFGFFAKVYFTAQELAIRAAANIHIDLLVDPEQALPLACGLLLPPILAGFVIAAIVAAICSTADSQLIVVSSSISRDILPFLRCDGSTSPGDTSRMNVVTRTLHNDQIVLTVLALIAVGLASMKSRVIFEFVLYAWSALGASFGPVVILGLLWKRASKAGAIAAMVTGTVVTVVWRNVPLLKGAVYELVPAFVLAMAAMVIFSLICPKRTA